jgi:hypothetical protein
VSGTGAVINIIGLDHGAEKFLHLIGIFVDAPGATDASQGIGAVLFMVSLILPATRPRASSHEASLNSPPFLSLIKGVVNRSGE